MYASFYTAPTTIHTLNGIPSPSFPFPPQHLSWISHFHALSPYSKSPVADIPYAHRRGTPMHALAGLALCAPCARIPRRPLRSSPCDPILAPPTIVGHPWAIGICQCACRSLLDTHRRRMVHPQGPIPGSRNTPPGPPHSPPRMCTFLWFWFSVFNLSARCNLVFSFPYSLNRRRFVCETF